MKKINAYRIPSLKSTSLGLLFFTLLSATSLQAQSLSPQTVHVAGGYAQAADFSLAYSVGEQSSISFYTTASESTLSAGFLQDFGFIDRDHLVLGLSLNNTSFEGSTTEFFIPIGAFTVKSSRTTTSTKTAPTQARWRTHLPGRQQYEHPDTRDHFYRSRYNQGRPGQGGHADRSTAVDPALRRHHHGDQVRRQRHGQR